MSSPENSAESTSGSGPDLEPVLDPEQAIDASAEELDLGAADDGGLESAQVAEETATAGIDGGEGPDPSDGSAATGPFDPDPAESERTYGTPAPANKAAARPSGSSGTKPLPPKAKAKAKAQAKGRPVSRAGDDTAGARGYTSPAATQFRPPSPIWVPITMFGLWGFGLLIIILNYMDVLPGTGDGGSGWYLIAGLVAILGGIVAATKYH